VSGMAQGNKLMVVLTFMVKWNISQTSLGLKLVKNIRGKRKWKKSSGQSYVCACVETILERQGSSRDREISYVSHEHVVEKCSYWKKILSVI
jgi:hypothetical protein